MPAKPEKTKIATSPSELPAGGESLPGVTLGKPMTRVDGRAKVTGTAPYSAEWQLPQLAHAVFATSPIAKGRIKGSNVEQIKKMPGVIDVFLRLPLAEQPKANTSDRSFFNGMSFAPLQGDNIQYSGQPVALVVAETLEQAEQAALQFKGEYDTETPAVFGKTPATVPEKVAGRTPGKETVGDPQKAFSDAPVKMEATYSIPFQHHAAMEPHATIAEWSVDGRVTLYDSTQGISGAQSTNARLLGVSMEKVRIISKYLGGGFGSKGGVWPHTALCAMAAKNVGRPVKLVLSRRQNFTSTGLRDRQECKISLGADNNGKVNAILHEKTAATSIFDDYVETNGNVIKMSYDVPNVENVYKLAHINQISPTFQRAPGEVPGSFTLESALDELAAKLNIDPLEIRLRNYADVDRGKDKPFSSKGLRECYTRGAELFGWKNRPLAPGTQKRGHLLVGQGMATMSYPVNNSPGGAARVRMFADGHVVASSGATDLGTGTYTVCAQTAAETLGVPLSYVRFELGDSDLPATVVSGGSMAGGTTASAVFDAARNLRNELIALAVADEKSPLFKAKPETVRAENGKLVTADGKSEPMTAIMKRAMRGDMEATGKARYGAPEGYSSHSFGACFVEVEVDPATGMRHVTRYVAVIDGGRIMNQKTARSQIMGGAVWGIGYALTEGTFMDDRTARFVNANLGEYHMAVNADVPSDMQIEFVETVDPQINFLGVKGIGEIGIVGVGAAIANAIYHATGKRIRELPITPEMLWV